MCLTIGAYGNVGEGGDAVTFDFSVAKPSARPLCQVVANTTLGHVDTQLPFLAFQPHSSFRTLAFV